jgi:dTDP-4-dehydrorhamnose 3,5-epimerase
MIEVRRLELPGVLEVLPRKFEDARGFFSETFNQADLAEHGIELTWVQDNHAHSTQKGILRGLHFQRPPLAQAKLIRVVRGSVFDAVVDIREGSPTFGKWLGIELSAERWNTLFVPVGFAHGYLTLGEAEVIYKVSAAYAPAYEQGIRFDDPAIGVDWPLPDAEIMVSDKDGRAGSLADAAGLFHWHEP